MANALITVLLSWFVLGLLWAALYDTVNNMLPTQFPTGMAESNPTWCVLLWIWNLSTVLIALSIGIAANGPKAHNQYGTSISGPIVTGFIVFISWTAIIMLWAIFYNIIFHNIPDAFIPFSIVTTPAYFRVFYDSGCVLMTVGLGIGMYARST
jgi:hypothetical protein